MNKKGLAIAISVFMLSLLVTFVDAIIQPNYFVKIPVKIIFFLAIPMTFFAFNKKEYLKIAEKYPYVLTTKKDSLLAKKELCEFWNLVLQPESEKIDFYEKLKKGQGKILMEILCSLIAEKLGVEKVMPKDLTRSILEIPSQDLQFVLPEHNNHNYKSVAAVLQLQLLRNQYRDTCFPYIQLLCEY